MTYDAHREAELGHERRVCLHLVNTSTLQFLWSMLLRLETNIDRLYMSSVSASPWPAQLGMCRGDRTDLPTQHLVSNDKTCRRVNLPRQAVVNGGRRGSHSVSPLQNSQKSRSSGFVSAVWQRAGQMPRDETRKHLYQRDLEAGRDNPGMRRGGEMASLPRRGRFRSHRCPYGYAVV